MVDCCDAKQLPPTNPYDPKGMMAPNPITLPARAWFRYSVRHPAAVIPVGAQSATIYASPFKPGDATSSTTLAKSAYALSSGAVLFAPGEWWLYYDAATVLEAVVLDAYSQPAMAALAGVKITGVAIQNADAPGDAAAALLGFLTNSRHFMHRYGTGDWAWVEADTISIAEGIDGAGIVMPINPMYAREVGATTIRAPRAGEGIVGDFISTAYGVVTNSRLGAVDKTTAEYARLAAIGEGTGIDAILGMMQVRESGYWESRLGRRFIITHYTPDATAVASNGYTATGTAPQVLLVNDAGGTDIIIRKIWAELVGDTNADVFAAVRLDPDSIYTSDGASFIPTNGFRPTNVGSAVTWTPTQARYNDGVAAAIVAAAADNDERWLGTKGFREATAAFIPSGTRVEWTLNDEGILEPSDSLALYVWGVGVTPTFRWGFEVAQLAVQ